MFHVQFHDSMLVDNMLQDTPLKSGQAQKVHIDAGFHHKTR